MIVITTRVATMKLLLHTLSLLLVLLAAEANKSNSGTCEAISVKICSSSDVFHKLTSTPITVKNGPGGGVTTVNKQKKSLRGTHHYVSLLRRGKACKKFLKPFVCAVYLPACDDTQMMRPIPPCKELCYQAMENCNEGFTNLGLEWPQELDCSLFPSSLEDPQCVSAYRILQKDVIEMFSQTMVQVTCSYDAKPRMQPRWVKNGVPVEEISERMRTETVDGHTTSLIIEGFTDSADGGVYTCAVENDDFGMSVDLDDIFQGPDCGDLTVPCPNGNKCISVFALCDGIQDCPSGTDEADCTDGGPFPPQTCEPYQVPCPSGDKCVPFSALCDGNMDCPSGLDESNCTGVGSIPTAGQCPPYTIPCPRNGDICYPPQALCDGIKDCPSGMDEIDCTDTGAIPTGQCPPYTIACPMNGDICIPLTALCDGINDCPSGMDETLNCTDIGAIPTGQCPPYTIACPMNGDICIPPTALCDGIPDCPSGMDETLNCTDTDTIPSLCPAGKLPCPLGDKCIPVSAICDGTPDCMSGVDETNCTSVSVDTCVPITLPECMVGLDYTMTIPNYPPGLSNIDKLSMLSSLSTVFDSTCGRFFRPFMCSAFLPPCREKVVPPCRELCFLAIKKCLETFDGILSEEDLMASGGSCDMMPSEADGQCYNVKVVSIGDVTGFGSEAGVEMSVECTYNLMPGIQPVWTDPSGNVIKTGSRRRVRTTDLSDTMTRLQIDNFISKRFGGTYTCSADGFSATVEL